ncbi:MAG: ETEC_3214 domain-containing protein [Candidatus Paceibacterota bacterium]|jgi:hypothetical protein
MTTINILTLVFSFFGGLAGLIFVYKQLEQMIFYKRVWLRKIDQLAASVNINLFFEILGSPVFINTSENRKQYVFINDLFYADATADLNGTVLMYTVTTRRSDFNPTLKLANAIAAIKLGIDTFQELDAVAFGSGKVSSGLGNRRAFYFEEYYFGNPGLYQTYLFGINDAGSQKGTEGGSVNGSIYNLGATETTDPRIQDFRKAAVINTFGVTAPYNNNLDEIGVNLRLGVDLDQVRTVRN